MPTNGKKSKKKKKIYEISLLIHLESRAQSEGSHLKPNALSQLVGSHRLHCSLHGTEECG